jgi:hypothetical protein
MYSQKWNCQSRIIIFCLPISTFMYLWAIYIFPGLVCLFCCSQIGRPILEIYKSLTDMWMQVLGTRLNNLFLGIAWIWFSVLCRIGPVHIISDVFSQMKLEWVAGICRNTSRLSCTQSTHVPLSHTYTERLWSPLRSDTSTDPHTQTEHIGIHILGVFRHVSI